MVSVIISTYNRYNTLMQAIKSVVQQTYTNIEIIIVNDVSSDDEYKKTPPNIDRLRWINLEKSSRSIFGYVSMGYVKNKGLSHARGEYIAILDDDDVWLPQKIELQLSAMFKKGYEFSCTEGYIGDGAYEKGKMYPKHFEEYFAASCLEFFKKRGQIWAGELPEIFDYELIKNRNFIIHSSVLVKKSLVEKFGAYQEYLPGGYEDRDLWLRILQYQNCLHLREPLLYYDGRFEKTRRDHQIHRRLYRSIKRKYLVFLYKFKKQYFDSHAVFWM